jgi:hypothetical protein
MRGVLWWQAVLACCVPVAPLPLWLRPQLHHLFRYSMRGMGCCCCCCTLLPPALPPCACPTPIKQPFALLSFLKCIFPPCTCPAVCQSCHSCMLPAAPCRLSNKYAACLCFLMHQRMLTSLYMPSTVPKLPQHAAQLHVPAAPCNLPLLPSELQPLLAPHHPKLTSCACAYACQRPPAAAAVR